MQMLAGGVMPPSSPRRAVGHPRRVDLDPSLVYLIVIGSWLAFTAYAWLLRTARTSLVSPTPT
jgi:hypothetical protein